MKRVFLSAVLAVIGILPVYAALAAEGCKLEPIGSARVSAVRDGRTLQLEDGRELRLAGIETVAGSRAALQKLAAGQPLRLERLNDERDRYGRLVAFAFAGETQLSLQQVMLAAGTARVSARVGDRACAAALLRTETAAREAKRGLWADPNFAPLSAENLPRLEAERGQFALVEGKVLSVRESGAIIYMNFGRRWTRDFSVTILRRQRQAFAAAGVELKKLEGHRVRVRGWIERRGGPIIAAVVPEQIELVD